MSYQDYLETVQMCEQYLLAHHRKQKLSVGRACVYMMIETGTYPPVQAMNFAMMKVSTAFKDMPPSTPTIRKVYLIS